MNRRLVRWRQQAGLTLIELLIGLVIVGILAGVGIPAYLGFLQRAREAMIIQYLREVHNGQVGWRIETDATEFTGDFDELEETGFIPGGQNLVKVRKRVPRRGTSVTTSTRIVDTYQLALTARTSGTTATYQLTASPQSRSRKVRWFYVDQTGVIRAATGFVGPGAPPLP
ncbi:MAG: prepilin-type N-terminal cleavage/methylation domain-containing protein [candidate division NC10 bacterium]